MSPHERIYSYQFESSNISLHLKDKNQTRRWWGWFPSSLLHRLEPAPCSPPRSGIVISNSPHVNTTQNIVIAGSSFLWILLIKSLTRQRHQKTPEPQLLPDEDIQKCQLEPSNPGLLQPPWNIDLGHLVLTITITMAVTTTTKKLWQQQTIVVTTTNNSCDNNKKRTISPALTAASRMVIAWSGNSSWSHNAHLHPGLLHLFRKDLKVLQGIFRKLN